jgi:hypothetical protein
MIPETGRKEKMPEAGYKEIALEADHKKMIPEAAKTKRYQMRQATRSRVVDARGRP